MRRHRSVRRRVFLSVFTVGVTLVLQIPWAPRTSDGVIPVAEIGIAKIEAQPLEELPAVPVRVRIPSVDIDATIVEVGLTGSKKLDVPARAEEVGWYNLGAVPGETGKAVLDGHLDIGGKPGIFWNLKHVKIGDTVEIQDDAGISRTFRVYESAEYHVSNAPMKKIFGTSDKKLLNIITCAGIWREEMNHYDKRRVVFAELIEEN